MRVSYDPKVDALMVVIKEGVDVARTIEVEYGLIDLDQNEEIVAAELLGASEIIERAAEMATTPDLEDSLIRAVTQYAQRAQEQLEHRPATTSH